MVMIKKKGGGSFQGHIWDKTAHSMVMKGPEEQTAWRTAN